MAGSPRAQSMKLKPSFSAEMPRRYERARGLLYAFYVDFRLVLSLITCHELQFYCTYNSIVVVST